MALRNRRDEGSLESARLFGDGVAPLAVHPGGHRLDPVRTAPARCGRSSQLRGIAAGYQVIWHRLPLRSTWSAKDGNESGLDQDLPAAEPVASRHHASVNSSTAA